MWCPNPNNVNSLGSGFGLQIYLLVGFLTVLQIQLQTQPKQPNYKYHCDFQPKNPLLLRLSPLPSLVYLPWFFCPPSFVSNRSPLFLLFLTLFFFFLAIHSPTPTYLPSLPLYNLFLMSLLFCQVSCNPTFTQNPKESSCLLRILSKLVPEAKQCLAKTSKKHFQCSGQI